MKGDPILLDVAQAEAVLAQFRETADFRRWLLLAGSVMANHVHLVVEAPATVRTDDLLRDLKKVTPHVP